MAAPLRTAQQDSTSALVELYELDTSPLLTIYGQAGQGSVYHWTAGTLGGQPVMFNGVTYQPMPIEVTGFEWSGQGKVPRPKLSVSNVGGLVTALVITFGDCLGAKVTRIRTFAEYLDGQPGADPSAYFQPDIFYINRKSIQSKSVIEFELAASYDQQGLQLPRVQVVRDSCVQSYRRWNPNTGQFVPGSCPYAGSPPVGLPYFKPDGTYVEDPNQDVCGKRLTDCMLRYGQNGWLPFLGFPGVADARA